MKQSLVALNHKFPIQWSPVGGAVFILSPGLCSRKEACQSYFQLLPEINEINVWILHL